MDGSSILLSQYNGNVSPSERATASMASGVVGGEGSNEGATHWFLLGVFLSWSAVTLAEKL